jgi:hypothetical protein
VRDRRGIQSSLRQPAGARSTNERWLPLQTKERQLTPSLEVEARPPQRQLPQRHSIHPHQERPSPQQTTLPRPKIRQHRPRTKAAVEQAEASAPEESPRLELAPPTTPSQQGARNESNGLQLREPFQLSRVGPQICEEYGSWMNLAGCAHSGSL